MTERSSAATQDDPKLKPRDKADDQLDPLELEAKLKDPDLSAEERESLEAKQKEYKAAFTRFKELKPIWDDCKKTGKSPVEVWNYLKTLGSEALELRKAAEQAKTKKDKEKHTDEADAKIKELADELDIDVEKLSKGLSPLLDGMATKLRKELTDELGPLKKGHLDQAMRLGWEAFMGDLEKKHPEYKISEEMEGKIVEEAEKLISSGTEPGDAFSKAFVGLAFKDDKFISGLVSKKSDDGGRETNTQRLNVDGGRARRTGEPRKIKLDESIKQALFPEAMKRQKARRK